MRRPSRPLAKSATHGAPTPPVRGPHAFLGGRFVSRFCSFHSVVGRHFVVAVRQRCLGAFDSSSVIGGMYDETAIL